MTDTHDLSRFTSAQEGAYGSYALALEEIRCGRKCTHWMWYIFPQLAGLGRSAMSRTYAIRGRAEAEAYLAHNVLGPRLREISTELLRHSGRSPREIMGPVDAVKLRSCMTLFDSVEPGGVFGRVLDAFYDGRRDRRSMV